MKADGREESKFVDRKKKKTLHKRRNNDADGESSRNSLGWRENEMGDREKKEAVEKTEDKRILKALQPCQREEQASNAVSDVRAALQIVNKWFLHTLLPHINTIQHVLFK